MIIKTYNRLRRLSDNSCSLDSLIFTQGTIHKNNDDNTFKGEEKRLTKRATAGIKNWRHYKWQTEGRLNIHIQLSWVKQLLKLIQVIN